MSSKALGRAEPGGRSVLGREGLCQWRPVFATVTVSSSTQDSSALTTDLCSRGMHLVSAPFQSSAHLPGVPSGKQTQLLLRGVWVSSVLAGAGGRVAEEGPCHLSVLFPELTVGRHPTGPCLNRGRLTAPSLTMAHTPGPGQAAGKAGPWCSAGRGTTQVGPDRPERIQRWSCGVGGAGLGGRDLLSTTAVTRELNC